MPEQWTRSPTTRLRKCTKIHLSNFNPESHRSMGVRENQKWILFLLHFWDAMLYYCFNTAWGNSEMQKFDKWVFPYFLKQIVGQRVKLGAPRTRWNYQQISRYLAMIYKMATKKNWAWEISYTPPILSRGLSGVLRVGREPWWPQRALGPAKDNGGVWGALVGCGVSQGAKQGQGGRWGLQEATRGPHKLKRGHRGSERPQGVVRCYNSQWQWGVMKGTSRPCRVLGPTIFLR
jgi:hypothetical protein